MGQTMEVLIAAIASFSFCSHAQRHFVCARDIAEVMFSDEICFLNRDRRVIGGEGDFCSVTFVLIE